MADQSSSGGRVADLDQRVVGSEPVTGNFFFAFLGFDTLTKNTHYFFEPITLGSCSTLLLRFIDREPKF